MGFTLPSQQSILPEIVGETHLMNAVSLNAITMNVMRILAPAAAGFLIDFIGFDAVYYTMSGMYLTTIAFMAFMRPSSPQKRHSQTPIFEIREGIRYIRNDATILYILLFTLVGVILAMPYVMLMPIFADDILKVGATGLGVLMSTSGLGAIISSLIMASLPNKKRGWMLLLSSLALGLTLIGFSFSNNWHLSLGLIALVGMAHTARMALSNTMLQYYTEIEYRGRVMSIFMMEFGLMSFGVFAAGLLTEAVGVQWALGSFSIIFVLISIMALIFLPRIRNLD
jgi:MFS transporter, DHA1 family, staphyloferrin A biosynthesis exporter